VEASLMPRPSFTAAANLLEIGKRCMQDACPGQPTKFGYHLHPYHSVGHLHMHAFVLPHKPWWLSWKYMKIAPWWLPADELIKQLEKTT